jgi:hypothetical protein
MAEVFKVEDGTTVEGANSYRDPADVTLYFEAVRGAPPQKWADADEDLQKAWCRFCSRWLDDWMRGRLPGETTTKSRKRLLFPRVNCKDTDDREITGVPEEVPEVVCDLIALHIAKPLDTVPARGGAIKRVKAASVEVEYRDDAPGDRDFSWIDDRLSGFLLGCSASVELTKDF